ncbi:Leucine carboxyl methyltransferase [Paramicrosporidium saccamoebae]|uniref:Leucine carboxyl methyltransferase 1 n=1 Tax=Paramicrosporidium saccamoebae TaxID=1246581 RepID=A0A2H9TL92_9FUNG|nr:Leucine carboxyl methyltransferase [Paramicrosporidium saccamoebae]
MDVPEEHEAIVHTNDEALSCRIALDMSGMFPDPFARLFQRHVHYEPTSPLILRASTEPVQVVTLGAGFDTRWHRLYDQLANVTRYLEIDFREVVHKKQRILGQQMPSQDPRYAMAAFDMEQDDQALLEFLQINSLSLGVKTIFIAECFLMYLGQLRVQRLLTTLSMHFPIGSQVILYDAAFIENDRFSSFMVENFARRNIRLDPFWVLSPEQICNVWAPVWTTLDLQNMSNLEQSPYLTEDDKLILRTRSILDEYEEWALVSSHYYLAILNKQ